MGKFFKLLMAMSSLLMRFSTMNRGEAGAALSKFAGRGFARSHAMTSKIDFKKRYKSLFAPKRV